MSAPSRTPSLGSWPPDVLECAAEKVEHREGFMEAPLHPAGPFEPGGPYTPQHRAAFLAAVAGAPAALRRAVAGLSQAQLDTRYRNWTVRQIVHHLADSHVNSYIRFKWALTEERPTIKAYDEGRWADLADSRTGDIAAPLALLEGLHARWAQLLHALTEEQFNRSFVHPDTKETITLSRALAYYAWHGQHHTAQIDWLRQQHGW
jgi:uncharacterized damage-inducible protein DinB